VRLPLQRAAAGTRLIDALVAAQVPTLRKSAWRWCNSLDAVVFNRHLPLVAPHTVFLLDRKAPSCRRADRRPHGGAARTGCKVALRGVSLDADDAPLLATVRHGAAVPE
jgi:EAL and modified HD-GYP domain-containing signal transduction protein